MATSIAVVKALIQTLGETQTLLALIINDPSDPENITKIADQFNFNKAVLKAAKSWENTNDA